MAKWVRTLTAVTLAFFLSGEANAEGISSKVTSVDQAGRCLKIEWNNDTEMKVCWTEKTKFAIYDTGKAAKPADVRKGSWLRMEGEEKGDTYWASEIQIWLAASEPPGS